MILKLEIKMPDCPILNGINEKYISNWKSKIGQELLVSRLTDEKIINSLHKYCDTDLIFKIMDQDFLNEYHSIGGSNGSVYICRHMVITGD